jgi:hypothetical protein
MLQIYISKLQRPNFLGIKRNGIMRHFSVHSSNNVVKMSKKWGDFWTFFRSHI